MGTLLFINRGHFAPRPGVKVLKAADYARLLEAEAVLETARAEVRAILEEARQTYEEEKKRGYADGLAEGKMEMAEQMMDTMAAGVDYLESLESTLVDLVMNAMHKIFEGFDDKERVLGVVRKGLGYVRSQKRVVLRVSPEDAETVQAEMRDLIRDYPGIGVLDVAADPRLAKGACILESELGLIDAGLEVQMAGIRKAFLSRLQQKAQDT